MAEFSLKLNPTQGEIEVILKGLQAYNDKATGGVPNGY